MAQWAEALSYAALVTNTCYAYQSQPDLPQLITSLVEQVNQRPVATLWAGVLLGSMDDMLELAMRSYTACGASLNEFSPFKLLENITINTRRGLAARVFSFLAYVYFETRCDTETPGEAGIDAIHRATHMANQAAALGFVSPVVLSIAKNAEEMGYRHRTSYTYENVHFNFEGLEDLWRVHDQRKAEVLRAEEIREKKMQTEPLGYVCAAQGCGMQGTRRASLQRCGGKCPLKWKPAYCSRECQKRDWKRHKPFCRSDGASDDWAVSLLSPSRTLASTSARHPPKTNDFGFVERPLEDMHSRRYERKIAVTRQHDRSMHVASSTMDTALMKELKAALERENVARPHAETQRSYYTHTVLQT